VHKRILKGNSGCIVELIEASDQKFFVRKTSSSNSYNDRLAIQMAKQVNFAAAGFNAPGIWDSGIDDEGRLYFDMEYVPGLKMGELLSGSLPKGINNQLLLLLDQLEDLKPSTIQIVPINEKLNEMQARGLKNDKEKAAINFLLNFEWGSVPGKECHGDMTLENLIYNDRGVYLLDFQDVVAESFTQDLAKLSFDLEWNWSARYSTSEGNNLVNFGNRISILRSIKQKYQQDSGDTYPLDILAFQLFNVVRMLPYIKDNESDKVVTEALASLLNRLKIS